jgi:hypothetical protein
MLGRAGWLAPHVRKRNGLPPLSLTLRAYPPYRLLPPFFHLFRPGLG